MKNSIGFLKIHRKKKHGPLVDSRDGSFDKLNGIEVSLGGKFEEDNKKFKDMKEKNDKFLWKNAKESSLAQFCTPRTRLHASNGKEKKRTKGRIGANYADFYRSNNFHETDDSSVSNFR